MSQNKLNVPDVPVFYFISKETKLKKRRDGKIRRDEHARGIVELEETEE